MPMGNKALGVQIRIAQENDHDQLIALAKRCPQEGMLTVTPIRKPCYNTLHRLLDPKAIHFVASAENNIVGQIGLIHFNARVLEKTLRLAYFLDFRVDEAYRGGTTSFRLVKTAVDYVLESDVDAVLVNLLKANKKPLVFTSGRGDLPASLNLGDNRIFNILPIRKLKLNQRFEICNPTLNDLPELVNIYNLYAQKFKIAQQLTEKNLLYYIESLDGITLDSFFVAKENGKIKAVTALWDERTYRAYLVLKFNTSIKLAKVATSFLSLFMKMPHPIRKNQPLNQLSLVLYAHENCPEALETLFKHANNINIGSDFTLISLYAQEKDPLFENLDKLFGVTVKSEMHLFAKDTSVFEQLANDPRPVMLDLVMKM